MFIARRSDNTIYGAWTVRQFMGQEEKPDNDPEVLAFLAATAALAQRDPNDFQNLSKAFRAKCISDLAFRLGVAPGELTPAQIQAERARIKAIAEAL